MSNFQFLMLAALLAEISENTGEANRFLSRALWFVALTVGIYGIIL